MTRVFAVLIAGLALAAVTIGPARAQDKITFAYLQDASYEAALWALRNGKVDTGGLEIEATPLAIPALIQATSIGTYDVIMTAVMAIPRARARGLDLRIVGTGLRYHAKGEGADIWVKSDSPIQTPADLVGKTIGVYALQSTGITLVRLALLQNHGLDISFEDGDITWVELPAPQLPAALATDRIEAGTLIHSQAFAASNSGEFRSIAQTAVDNFEHFGVRPVSAVFAGYGDRLDANPDAHRAFLAALKASVDYALANPEEVFSAVADETGVDPAFFERWFSTYGSVSVAVSDDDVTAMETLWTLSQEQGILDGFPPMSEALWDGALRE